MMEVKVTQPSLIGSRNYPIGIYQLPTHLANQLIGAGRAELLRKTEAEVVVIPKNILNALEANEVSLEEAKEMTLEELISLDGIGEKTAKKILDL